MKRPEMTPLGHRNVLRLIRHAETGSRHAHEWLCDLVRRESEGGATLPTELLPWLAQPPFKRGRGRPTGNGRATTVFDVEKSQGLKETAAWAAWWNVRAGLSTSSDGAAGPAFQEVADWLAAEHCTAIGASAVRTWYYAAKAEMDRQHAEIAALAASL